MLKLSLICNTISAFLSSLNDEDENLTEVLRSSSWGLGAILSMFAVSRLPWGPFAYESAWHHFSPSDFVS